MLAEETVSEAKISFEGRAISVVSLVELAFVEGFSDAATQGFKLTLIFLVPPEG